MKILHVNFARGFRGGERQTLNLIEGLDRLGVEQTMLCRSGAEMARRLVLPNVHIVEVRHPLLGHLSVPAADLIHVHEARGAYWAAIECGLRGTRYLITRRIPNPISTSTVTQSVYRKAAALVGVSQDVARGLSAQTGGEVATILDSCTVHAVDQDKLALIRSQLTGYPIIGHVGALVDHHKGQSILIDAFHRFGALYPDARLLLVGEGPDREHFRRLAAGDPRIVFAGFQEDVGSWIAAMDLFAFPSREEGLGSSVLDAMLLDVPVVAAAVGGLPELIGTDERGLLVHSADPDSWCAALRRLVTDAPLRNQLKESASAFARQNDVEAMSRRYLSLYQALAADTGVNINPA